MGDSFRLLVDISYSCRGSPYRLYPVCFLGVVDLFSWPLWFSQHRNPTLQSQSVPFPKSHWGLVTEETWSGETSAFSIWWDWDSKIPPFSSVEIYTVRLNFSIADVFTFSTNFIVFRLGHDHELWDSFRTHYLSQYNDPVFWQGQTVLSPPRTLRFRRAKLWSQ